ncbi:GNAT family N-acetyltransferase [Ruegeria arenilitoris]|uniref:GNAT family N-acetyltransferase n=1 Tax=Ruegeria arenilitoris TaxID=1173585 RepID=UPI00147DEE22|nr:GNAT family N-acetyltransferase [Ruegeria arenilitoris]
MQNKRGISQALSPGQAGVSLRRATVFDVFGVSQVLVRSITRLCEADHGNQPDKIAAWTANKDPQSVRNWIISGTQIWLAEWNGNVAAVGGLRAPAEISLLYVDPDHAGQGVGAALLSRLEAELALSGATTVHLMSTKTALDFYRRNGWVTAGQPADWNGIPQFSLRKSLHPSG